MHRGKIRKVTLGDVDEETRASVCTALDKTGKDDLCIIEINSEGGCISCMFAILAAMDSCSGRVVTFVRGEACSAAAVVLANGTPGLRFAAKRSTVMVHQALAQTSGDLAGTNAMMRDSAELSRVNKKMLKFLRRRCGAKITKKITDDDLYLSRKKAKKLGFVDHCYTPRFALQVVIKKIQK